MTEENTTTNTRKKNKHLKIALLAIIIIIAIVGTIFGIYFGVRSSSDAKTAADVQKDKKEDGAKKDEVKEDEEKEKKSKMTAEEKRQEEFKKRAEEKEKEKERLDKERERLRLEKERKAEEERKAEKERKRIEEERKVEAERKAEEERIRAENERIEREKQEKIRKSKERKDNLRKMYEKEKEERKKIVESRDDEWKKIINAKPKSLLYINDYQLSREIQNKYENLQFYKDLDGIDLNGLFAGNVKQITLNGFEYTCEVQKVYSKENNIIVKAEDEHVFTLKQHTKDEILKEIRFLFYVQEESPVIANGEFIACVRKFPNEEKYLFVYEMIEVDKDANINDKIMAIIEVSKYAEIGDCEFFDFNPDALVFCNFFGKTRLSLAFQTYSLSDHFVKAFENHQSHSNWRKLPTDYCVLKVRYNSDYGWKAATTQQDYFRGLANVFRYMILKDNNPKLTLNEFKELDPGYQFDDELKKFYEDVDLNLVHLCMELREYNGYLSSFNLNNIDDLVQNTVRPEKPTKKPNESEEDFKSRKTMYDDDLEKYNTQRQKCKDLCTIKLQNE